MQGGCHATVCARLGGNVSRVLCVGGLSYASLMFTDEPHRVLQTAGVEVALSFVVLIAVLLVAGAVVGLTRYKQISLFPQIMRTVS